MQAVQFRSRIHLPQRQRQYRFALTPLADAMFQLLIFFMLTSGLTPYSLLTVKTADGATGTQAAAGQNGNAPTAPAMPALPGQVALWTLEPGSVVVGGQRFGFDALDDLAGALAGSQPPAQVVLILHPQSQVQDVSTVLAHLQAADIGSVRIAASGGPEE